MIPLVRKLEGEKSPAVLRECAIALRHNKPRDAPALWAHIAGARDGSDRWRPDRWGVEALGIGADGQWDAYLQRWIEASNATTAPWLDKAGRDIIWRSRGKQTPDLLFTIIFS